mgnify:CR=1 FL=1
MLFPCAVQNGKMEYVYSSKSKQMASYILSKPEYRSSKLYSLDWWSDLTPGADIYLRRNGIEIYNKNNVKRGTFEDLK